MTDHGEIAEEQAEFEQFVSNIGKPNAPEVEEFLAYTDGEFLDLEYDPEVFGEMHPGIGKRLLWAFRRLRWALRDIPVQFRRE